MALPGDPTARSDASVLGDLVVDETVREPLTDPDEQARLAAVRRYDVLDSPPDGAFDRAAALASRLFGVPIATVTIVDEDRIWFKALHGLDASEVPRDPGLCASVILNDACYVVNDGLTDPRTLRNSLVHGALGVRFYAAAPLVTHDGYRLGTVNVIDVRPRHDVAADALAALQDLAAVVMDQLELRLSAMTAVSRERELRQQAETERAGLERTARLLRLSLEPPPLPQVPGLDIATYYRPVSSEGIGGDFYDLLAAGRVKKRWVLFIGDVAGKGLLAATVTSLTRYTLRAAAIHGSSPSAALTELNTAIFVDEHDIPYRFCTAIYAQIDRARDGFVLQIANAGHPGLFILRSDGTHVALPPTGPPVGALPDATFETVTTRLRSGDAALLITDGVTDARIYGERRLGHELLVECLTGCTGDRADQIIGRVVDLLQRTHSDPRDDIAMVAISVPKAARR